MEEDALEDERVRQEVRLREFEQDFLELLILVHNTCLPRALVLPDSARVTPIFSYLRPRENLLQEAQSRTLLYSQGLADVIEDIMEINGVSETQAMSIFEKRMQRWQDNLQRNEGSKVAGIDEIGKQTGLGQ